MEIEVSMLLGAKEEPISCLNYDDLSKRIVERLDELKIRLNFQWDILPVSYHYYKEGYPYFYDYSQGQSIDNTDLYELIQRQSSHQIYQIKPSIQ